MQIAVESLRWRVDGISLDVWEPTWIASMVTYSAPADLVLGFDADKCRSD